MKRFAINISLRQLKKILFFCLIPIACVLAFSHQKANIPDVKIFSNILDISVKNEIAINMVVVEETEKYTLKLYYDKVVYDEVLFLNNTSLDLIHTIERYKEFDDKNVQIQNKTGRDTLSLIQQKINNWIKFSDSMIPDYSHYQQFQKQYLLSRYLQYTDSTNWENWLIPFLDNADVRWRNCILSGLQSDIAISTRQMMGDLIVAKTPLICFNFDEIMTLAVLLKPYVLQGESVPAMIVISEYLKNDPVDIRVKNARLVKVERGVASVETVASELGLNKISGSITSVFNEDTITRNWSTEFFVAAKGCQMQLDKANVCYVGVPNPVTLSVPGYPETALNLRVAGAEVKKLSDGHFEIYFNNISAKPVYAFVDATNKQGRTSAVASLKIITRNLPDPVARLGNLESNTITIADATNADAIHIRQANDDFEMEYNLVNFEFSVIKNKERKLVGPVVAQTWHTSEINEIMSNLQPGDKIYIDEVKAKDAAGRLVYVLPMSYLVE